MFEDKNRKRVRRLVLLIFLIFIAGGFAVGYYLNVDTKNSTTLPDKGVDSGLEVPDQFINPANNVSQSNSTGSYVGELVSNLDSNEVGPNTKLLFRSTYTRCGHVLEKKSVPTAEEIKMKKEELQQKYKDWEIEDFSRDTVILKRIITAFCPNHFVIGIYGGNIAVYEYNENGEKILKEETEISVATLTPEDQKALHDGIIADSEEELYLKIEGFSN